MASSNILGGCNTATKIAYGTEEVTATAAVTTGLTSITSAIATLVEDAAVATGMHVTTAVSGGTLTLKVWMATGAGDTTPTASGTAQTVHWLAIGT